MDTLIEEFTRELTAAIAEGAQVIPQEDGTEKRIRYEQMDREARSRFLGAVVDFTDYVNRGMEPSEGDAVIERLLGE